MSELDHMDALAAEYVLGTLDFEEREQARTLLEADAAFAAKVESWERRFGDLYLMVEPVEPDSAVWPRIRAKMLEVRERTRAAEPSIPASAPAPTAAEPPSLDAIEAVISKAATTLNSEATSTAPEQVPPAPVSEMTPMTAAEATPAPGSEPTPLPVSEAPTSEATPAPASEGASALMPEMPPAPALEMTRTAAVEAVPGPPVAAASAESAPQAPSEPQARSEAQAQTAAPAILSMHRQLRRWRAFAVLMTLIVVAAGALLAAWRFAPDRVPPMLQPLELMRQAGVPLPAIPAPRNPASTNEGPWLRSRAALSPTSFGLLQ
jgi:anti-sigma-K factor RskA